MSSCEKMKHTFLLFIAILLAQYTNSQSWYHTYAPHGRDVSASAIPNGTNIILGAGFEGAEQFEDYFTTADFAMSGGGWEVLPVDTPTSQVKSMVFSDSLNGYAVCYRGKMVKTTNGGHHWTLIDTVANKNFFKVIYVNPQTLYIAGGSRQKDTSTILKSTDGGNTWSIIYNQPGSRLKSICFIDTLKGFAVGDSSEILSTIDAGSHWTPVSPPVTNRSFNGVVFLNASTGYIIGGTRDTARTTLLKTIDGGQNWTVLKDAPGGQLNDVIFINASEGYMVGDSATVLKTTNGGLNWVQQVLPNTVADQQINTIAFSGSGLGVIGGMGAYVEFYTISSLPEATTEGAMLLTDSTAVLFGAINTHGQQAAYSFIYSTDSSFTNFYGYYYPGQVISDSAIIFQYTTDRLIPDTTYYYAVYVTNLAGSVTGEKKTFFTHLPNYSFLTLGPNVTSTSATLTGSVDNLPSSTNLYFEYGTSPSLGHTIAANPPVVNDTLAHAVSVTLNSLTPFIPYYYRLKGTGNGVNYYGVINTVTIGTVFSVLQTLQASNQGTTTATLNGLIDKFNLPVTLSFEYDTGLQFGHSVPAVPAFVNDTLEHQVYADVAGLESLTQYSYRIKAHTSLGDFYGIPVSFMNGVYGGFETTPATNVTTTAATLNGAVDKFHFPVTLTFEYGTNPSVLDHFIPAGVVNDTLQHDVFANVSMLQPNAQYYFRLKANTSAGDFAGNTLSFNTGGNNQIITTIKVYPNPCITDMSVDIVPPSAEESMVQIFDLNGKLCKQTSAPALAHTVSFSILDMEKGCYAVRVILGKQRLSKKFVVIK